MTPGVVPTGLKPGVVGPIFQLGIASLKLEWRVSGGTLEELLARVTHELRTGDMTSILSRRDLLGALIGFPLALNGLARDGQAPTLPAEELLPLYMPVIPACWKLHYEGELTLVERAVSSYIAQLTPLAQQASKHQKTAASLLAQAHQLASCLVLEHEDFGSSLAHCKEALHYGQQAEDPNLQLGAYIRKGITLYYRKREKQFLQNYQEAREAVPIEKASPLVQGRVYSGLADGLSMFGQTQEALRYNGLAHDTFPDAPTDDPSFLFLPASQMDLHINSMLIHLRLGNLKEALGAITQAAMFVPETALSNQAEILNHRAQVARAMNGLEECCDCLEQAIGLGRSFGSELYASEARAIIEQLPEPWQREPKVKNVRDLLDA
jgi:tetratricopeptide (TPR) repeat protein